MPELPEVETISRDLNDLAIGNVIEDVAISFNKIITGNIDEFRKILKNSQIISVERMAKMVKFNLSKGVMLVHLRMTGQFHLGFWPEDDWGAHDRAAFKLSNKIQGYDSLIYKDIRKFGRLQAFTNNDFENYLKEKKQGADLFQINASSFREKIIAKNKKHLKAVLLDQSIISGLGNIYVDECLFRSGLSPLKEAASLTENESKKLLAIIKDVLTESITMRGSTISNYQGLKGPGEFQNKHLIYGKAKKPCPNCGSEIQKITVAGRGTCYCPVCQHD